MQQQSTNQKLPSRLYDQQSLYGWVSIILHWTTASAVVVIWYLGNSVVNGAVEESDSTRQLHVSIAATAWLVILLRIIWRIRSGHPQVSGQSAIVHRIASSVHYGMLFLLLLMLASGPLLVWSSGKTIDVFDWFTLPTLVGASESLKQAAWFVHSNASLLLLWLVLLHIGGTLKHLMFHSDDTVARMIWPGKKTTSGSMQ